MESTALTPYRTAALSAPVEPIDESIIPDCGRRETAKIENEIERLRSECKEVVDANQKRVFFPFFLGSASALSIALLNAIYAFKPQPELSLVYVLMVEISLAVGIFVGGIASEYAKIKVLAEPPAPEEVALQSRLTALKSLEDLTRMGRRAQDLLEETRAFNGNLHNLAKLDCSKCDREIIAARREELMGRICDFRGLALAAPEESAPPLLTAGCD